MRRAISVTLSLIKYGIALLFMVEGVDTMVTPLHEHGGRGDWVYSHRSTLVVLGFWFFISGVCLFYGKVRHHRNLVGYSLMSMYLSFLFASIIGGYAHGWEVEHWAPNMIASLVIGALYLRWKYHILYVPRPTRKEVLDDLMHPEG